MISNFVKFMATFWLGLLVKLQGKSNSFFPSSFFVGFGIRVGQKSPDNIPDQQHWNQVLKLSGDFLFPERNVKTY
jgi:hypothetical protein